MNTIKPPIIYAVWNLSGNILYIRLKLSVNCDVKFLLISNYILTIVVVKGYICHICLLYGKAIFYLVLYNS